MKIWSMVTAKAAVRYFFLVLFAFALFSHSAYASTISGGSYMLNGGPTAISSAESSGGTYSEQSTADPASGNSSGGNSQNQNSGSQNTTTNTGNSNNNPPSGNTSGYSGGVSGQIVMEKLPTTSGTSASGSSGMETNGAGTGGAGSGSGGSSTILITQVRLVRGTPTSITVHFITSVSALGTVRYSPYAGEVTTLTDSAPSIYHTFTITNLTPAFVYQLQLAAISETGAASSVYEVSVSPDEIGEEGSSAGPVLVSYHAFATQPAPLASSSMKNSSFLHALPPYILVLLLLIIAIIIYIVWRRRRRSQ